MDNATRMSARLRVFPITLSLHCTYSRDQIFAGPGRRAPGRISVAGKCEGVLYLGEKNLDIFFITLNKPEKHFSPSTMYNDYAISEWLSHVLFRSTKSASDGPVVHQWQLEDAAVCPGVQ